MISSGNGGLPPTIIAIRSWRSCSSIRSIVVIVIGTTISVSLMGAAIMAIAHIAVVVAMSIIVHAVIVIWTLILALALN